MAKFGPILQTKLIPDHMKNYPLIPRKEFEQMCRCGGFTDYDGYGQYVQDGRLLFFEEGSHVYPSDILKEYDGGFDCRFDHIIWFNR